LFAWLLGTEVSTSILKKKNHTTADIKEDVTYFDMYSKEMLVEAIKYLLKEDPFCSLLTFMINYIKIDTGPSVPFQKENQHIVNT